MVIKSFIVSLFVVLAYSGNVLAQSVSDFAWLAGCWEINQPERKRVVSEQWMKPAGGLLLGMARTVRDGKTVNYEFTRIEEREGGVFYVAKPVENATETFFKMIRSTANEWVFEDPDHDFPQRIIYKKTGADSMTARIEGTRDGKPAGIDYPFKRVKCD